MTSLYRIETVERPRSTDSGLISTKFIIRLSFDNDRHHEMPFDKFMTTNETIHRLRELATHLENDENLK